MRSGRNDRHPWYAPALVLMRATLFRGYATPCLAPQPGHEAAHAVRADNFAPLAAAIELGSLRVSNQVRTPQSIVRMADFNARGIDTFLGSLAILWVMGRPRHSRPLIEVRELAIVGATLRLPTEPPVSGSWW